MWSVIQGLEALLQNPWKIAAEYYFCVCLIELSHKLA